MIRIGIQFFLNRSGPCSASFLEAGGFCKSSPDREYPNIHFHFFPAFVIDHGLDPAPYFASGQAEAIVDEHLPGVDSYKRRLHTAALRRAVAEATT